MLADVVPLLCCPVCRAALSRDERILRCGAGHRYDIARQGYVTLLAGRAPVGDTAAMVTARHAFLSTGHYDWLADLVASHAAEAMASGGPGAAVVDAGAGTGHYLARVLDRVPAAGIALDSSGYALRRAVRAHPRIGAVRADLWRPLPLADRTADLVLNVFAPRNGAEFRRILRPGGRLLTVTPTPRHLTELVDRLGLLSVDAAKQSRLADALGDQFTAARTEEREVTMSLDHAAVTALVGMGPSAWHADPDDLDSRIASLPPTMSVTASCSVTLWRPRPL
ncbi:MAG: putative RNA methyltransferase [Micromonosporaceae bacterium]